MPVIVLGLLAFGMFIRVTDLLEEVEHLKKKVHLLNAELDTLKEPGSSSNDEEKV